MKKLILLTTAFFIFNVGYSQVQVGPRAGISSSKISLDGGNNVQEGDRKFGFHIGAFARFNLGFIYFQPELLFTSTKGEIEFNDNANTTQQIADLEYNKLDIPLLLGLNFGALRLNAGPSLSLLLKADAKEGGVTEDVKNNYNDATVGYQLGIGTDIGNLILDLKYEGSLSKFSDGITFKGTTYNTDQRSNQIILSLGIILFE